MTVEVTPKKKLMLTRPEPVVVIDAQDVDPDLPETSLIEIDEASRSLAVSEANAFVQQIVNVPVKSPQFMQVIKQVEQIGRDEIMASSRVSSRMLDRPASALEGAKGKGGDGSPQQKVAKTLVDLRTQVEDLTPQQGELSAAKKMFKFLGGDKVSNYFKKYQSAQSQLDAITRALEMGRDELYKDNAAIQVELNNAWDLMHEVGKRIVLVGAVGRELEQRIAQVSLTNPTQAQALKADALFVVNQKHQDLITTLGVVTQGFLSLQMIVANNTELAKGVDRAETVTLSALRTAIIIHQALTNQELVLNQITALNRTTSELLRSNAQMLHTQGVRIHENAVNSGVEVQALHDAFDEVFATMDEIDNFRASSADTFAQTITAMESKITQARPYIERALAQNPQGQNAQIGR